MLQFPKAVWKRGFTLALAVLLTAQTLAPTAAASPGGETAVSSGTAVETEEPVMELAAAQTEPKMAETDVPAKALDQNGKEFDTTVKQYTYTFSSVPATGAEMAQYKLDSPYKAMALLIMAFRAWRPDNEKDCLEMLDYLTDTGATLSGSGKKCPFSQYNPWVSALRDRMLQNDKWKYIGSAYLKGATPGNNYTPTENTVTLRQSVYDPYAKADEWGPEQKQVLVFFPGADNERYCLFYQDDGGNWKVYNRSWINLLADIKTADENKLYPPEYPSVSPTTQKEPTLTKKTLPAKAAGTDESGNPIVFDTTVEEYTYTFTTVPETYQDIIQYKLDSPYKTMALLFLAFRTWRPDNETDCLQMMDYLTNTNANSGKTDAQGHKLSTKCSEYNSWTSFIRDRMKQNDKYRYIGNAYLGGASPKNDYTPNSPVTVTLRQSVYDPYKAAEGESPELKQVLIHIDGADNDRYSLLYEDQRGDWRIFGDNWKGLLADVQKPLMDIFLPPEYPAAAPTTQKEPTVTTRDIPAQAAGVDDAGNPIVIDTTVKEYTFTFSTVPETYEDIIQYKLDSPYKAMALLIMAFRTWTPENKANCEKMLNYLTNTAIDSGKTNAQGRKLSKNFSDHQYWTDFLRDRMRQNEKYRYIGNAYLKGATPSNNYTPAGNIVTVRESVYNPYKKDEGHLTDPTLYQVLIHLDGDDSDRYSLFYQDERGDWRVFGDNWQGLLADIKTPVMDVPYPPEVKQSQNPAHPQTEPTVKIDKIPGKGLDGNGKVIDITLDQYTYTFSTVPTSYEDIVQYKLDSPYKTMALLFLAFRTWKPTDQSTCAKMLDYLTNTAAPKPGAKDAQGNLLSYPFSEYNSWTSFLADRMKQNEKYRYIGNAYLKGATPGNNYTPADGPVTITVRQSAYDPYKEKAETTPELKQVLISLAGDDSPRYSLFYQDQRGDWRVFGDNWQGLLADVKTPADDIPWPAEVKRSQNPAHPQTEPTVKIDKIPGKGLDENGKVIDITLDQYTFTFSTVPASYEDIVQYKLDSPYKTMALLFLAFRTWKPDSSSTCEKMLDYLTNTAALNPYEKDGEGHKLAYGFSAYTPWKEALKDRMKQNNKYQFIGNAYLKGATPGNGYTPDSPVTVVVRQSAYDPYKEKTETTPELKQVLVSLAGDDSPRYSLFYQDQRGDWRVFGDNWMGLLADVQESGGEPAIVDAALANNKVAFRLENVDGIAYVTSCADNGRMVSFAPAEIANSGYEAVIPDISAKCRIVVVDRITLRPLCKPVELTTKA